VRLSPETCRVKPLRRIKTQLLYLVGLISLLSSHKFHTIKFVRDIAICWLTERFFSRQTFLEGLWFRIDGNILCLYWILPKQLFLNNEANVTNWHCCFKRRPREANVFHVPRLASAWGSTINFNILFLMYTSLKIRWSPKEFA
jgi:hypothetical protein